MKVQFKSKMTNIERSATDAVVVKIARTTGKVLDGPEKAAPEAKIAEMSLEFALRPVIADHLRIGQPLLITIEAVEESDGDR